jgi:hypothetical protein
MPQDDRLRALEREARAAPSAGAWSRLAFALARAGRASEAEPAACRALSLDPGDPARALLAPCWNEFGGGSPSVPWRGLRALGRRRPLPVAHAPAPDAKHADLGGGLLLYKENREERSLGYKLVAVDAWTGARSWVSSRRFHPIAVHVSGERIVVAEEERDLELVTLDRSTGETVDVPRSIASSLGHTLSLHSLDEKSLVVARVTETYSSGRTKAELLVLDLHDGRVVSHVPLEPGLQRVSVCGGVIYADGQPDVAAFTPAGRECWRLEAHAILASAGGSLLLAAGEPTRWLSLVDGATGALLQQREILLEPGEEPEGALVTEASIVLELTDRLLGLDPVTLDPLWAVELEPDAEVLSTADALLVVTEHARGSLAEGEWRHELAAVVALDPATGLELSRLEVPCNPHGRDAHSIAADAILIAGRLLLPSASRQPTFHVIEGADDPEPIRLR